MPSRSSSMKDLRRELTLHLVHGRFPSYRHLTAFLFAASTREPFPGSAECAWTWPSSSSSTRRWSSCSTTCGRRSRGTPGKHWLAHPSTQGNASVLHTGSPPHRLDGAGTVTEDEQASGRLQHLDSIFRIVRAETHVVNQR